MEIWKLCHFDLSVIASIILEGNARQRSSCCSLLSILEIATFPHPKREIPVTNHATHYYRKPPLFMAWGKNRGFPSPESGPVEKSAQQ